jgi:hypothetical protein
MATLRPIPQPSVPVVDPKTGLMTQDWFLYFKSREQVGIANLSDVSSTAPTDGQALLYDDSTGKWTPDDLA